MENEIIYRARAYRAHALAAYEPKEWPRHTLRLPDNPMIQALRHASWLCMQVPALVGAGDEAKARRYLATAEAMMFVHGVCTWDEVESLNNNPERVR